MNKILVAVFDDERKAFEGLTALKELHRDGDISIYGSAVVAKDAEGKAKVLDSAHDLPIGAPVGVIAGSLVGLFGGPVAAAAGAYVGGMGGLFYDLFTVGLDSDFTDSVSETLTPGKVAVVADVDETWITPVDTRMAALGATTYRQLRGEMLDDQLMRETEAANAELDELEAELKEVNGEAKTKVQSAIDAQRTKLNAIVARIDKALEYEKQELQKKLATLDSQRKAAHERQRGRIDARAAELKASSEARQAKLRDARKLAKQSLELTREAVAV